MRLFKYILIGLVVSTVAFMLYFATQVSEVYDPIKTYQFPLTKDELRARLTQIPNLTITFSDTIGTEKTGIDYHCDVTIKNEADDFAYHFIYKKEDNRNDKDIKSEIELISAIDYKLKIEVNEIDDEEADRLIDIFERGLIDKLLANISH